MGRLSILRRVSSFVLFLALILFLIEKNTFVVVGQTETQSDPPLAGAHVLILNHVNIRSGPTTAQTILGVAQPGQRFAITGRSEDNNWWQIDYQGQAGWVYAPLVEALSVTDTPIVAPSDGASPTDPLGTNAATVLILQFMNIRSGPGTNFAVIATGEPGGRFAISGKNATGTWWQIDYQGQEGWVSAGLVQAENSANVRVVPAEFTATVPTSPPTAVILPTPTPTIMATATSRATATSAPTATATAQPVASLSSSTGFDPTVWNFRLELIFDGLTQPIFVTHAGDGTNRLFGVEKAGRITVYDTPKSKGVLFLDITDRVGDNSSERGLLGLAFAPNFESTGYFFVNYTNNEGNTVIARYQVSAKNPVQADVSTEFVILRLEQPAANHNGGMILFGPDEALWVGTGDGGGRGDTYRNGQNPDTMLGKMLRLDVLSNPKIPYTIPANNPWLRSGWNGQAVNDEIWALGLRNPWRYSFDRSTGDLWIADVGQNRYEEINLVPAAQVATGGLNFGWPLWEGMHCFSGTTCESDGIIQPVAEYEHERNGCSVTGGYVYRGREFPQLEGVYFYADYCTGYLWALWRDNKGAIHNELVLSGAGAVSSFGEDEAGEIYVVDYRAGSISHLVVEPKSR